MRVLLRMLLIAVAFIGPACADLLAQGGPPVGGPPPCWPPPCIPIDGGISLLIGAGALLGGKKALDLRRAAKSASN
ncbi:MAG: hypothetical protein IPN85_13010 [Flavobacteriales bacterium]|nr:hypothetical protein [Flavobacteriales bacterium]MBK9288992.1 hypothetical protein [Flavobacteriales bacterium]